MKTIFISLLLLVLAGCGNQSEKTSSANNQTTPADSKPVVDNPEEVSVKSEKDVQNTEPGKKGKQKIIKDQKGNPIYPAATDDAVTPNEKKGASNETGNGIDADGKALNTNFKDEASTDDNTIIYVGIFAQWNYDNGDHYDGSYDTTHRLFILSSLND